MLRLSDQDIVLAKADLANVPNGKVLINTINAHSFNVAQKDPLFAEALDTSSRSANAEKQCRKFLIPDGASVVMACKLLHAQSRPKERIAGWDLFVFEMQQLNDKGKHAVSEKKKVLFVGSSDTVLQSIVRKAAVEYPYLDVITYSPPYKKEFSADDTQSMVSFINQVNPDLLWIGMTAPKQEKWAWQHWNELNIHCHVGTIGAVFDFFAGTMSRAPLWWQNHSLEWLYRLLKEPRRMWRRYLLGNMLFVWNILSEKFSCSAR